MQLICITSIGSVPAGRAQLTQRDAMEDLAIQGGIVPDRIAAVRPTRQKQTRARPAAQPEPGLAIQAAPSSAATLAEVAAVAASVLGFAPLADQPLMEAGLDSLGAVELRNALGARFGAELPATVTLDHPTLAALAAHLQGLAAVPKEVTSVGAEEVASWVSSLSYTLDDQVCAAC